MHQQRKTLGTLFLVLILSNSCKRYEPPETELCAYAPDASLVCNAPYADPEDYERLPEVGDLCTNPRDYQRIREYAIDLREKLIRCERQR